MSIQFFYFDLGKVLVDFSIDQMLAQMAEVSLVEVEMVRRVVFENSLLMQLETGRITNEEFYGAYCRMTRSTPEREELQGAAAEIFSLNAPVVSLVEQMHRAGLPMGILSNTCDIHWEYCFREYSMLRENFDFFALSYQIGAVKPERDIFLAASELADCEPDQIFFVDDIAGNVEGAKAVGFDAVLYTSAGQLAEELRGRGVSLV